MSIIRPVLKRSAERTPYPVRRNPGRILIGLLAIAAGVAALVPAISSAGSPHGTHKLVFRIDGQARQDVVDAGGIVVTASCPTESCTVVASAKAKRPSVHTGKVRMRVSGGGSQRMMLPLGAKDAEKLGVALAAGEKPALTVNATARDGYGAEVPLKMTVTALRG
jgi:hypothetical protein